MEVTSRYSKKSTRERLVSSLPTCVPVIQLHFSGLDFLTRKKCMSPYFSIL